MQLIADGYTYLQIAAKTGAELRTIENRMYRLRKKYNWLSCETIESKDYRIISNILFDYFGY